MRNRLVAPFAFIFLLIILAVVLQSLGSTPPTRDNFSGPDLLKQYEVVEVILPPSTLTDAENKKIELSISTNTPTLITFWNTNCGECDTGLPVLENFANQHNQITFKLISVKDRPKDAQEKLNALGVKLESYFDLDGRTFENWGATMPASYFIINGKVRYYFPGRITEDHLNSLLTQK